VPYGAAVLSEVLRAGRFDTVVFSALGVREGYLYALLDPEQQQLDPLMEAAEEMSVLRSRSPAHAGDLMDFTGQFLEAVGIAETADEQRLRRVACYLADIGWRGHPDYRGEKALGLIAQSSFLGVDHPGRAFLALAVYYSHERALSGEFSPALRKLAGRALNRRAQILGTAARFASKLSLNLPGIINQTAIGYNKNNLVLELPAKLEALDGEELRRRFKVLALLLNCEPEIRFAPKVDPAKSILRFFGSQD
jgi:exopolyphosphatase/guanosine-5'-triphosphate,3'-diphosphate pyrophosphatase